MAGGSIDDHLGAAMRARQSGRIGEARRHLEAVILIDPVHSAARNILGLEALAAGDPQSAAEHLECACRGDPDAAELWLNLASARRALNQPDAEQSALEEALQRNQRFLPALIRLAQLHERLGQEEPATERWSAVLALGSSLDDPSGELKELLAHAKDYVGRQREGLAQALDGALAGALAAASTRVRQRVQVATDTLLGRRRIYSNDCHGLHYPFLPADEFFDRSHFGWLQTLERATDEIRKELKAILDAASSSLTPYVEQPPGVPHNKWSQLDHSLDWSALHLWRDGERDDAACALAPKTAKLVEQLPLCRIPGRAPAVFFSILRAGKHIPPHSGVTNVRSIVHLPLIVPRGCSFRVGGETRAWREGEAFVFDDTIEHEAHNPTKSDRALLILDCWNPYLDETEQAMICEIYKVSAAHKMR